MKNVSIVLPECDLHRAEIVLFERGMLSIELQQDLGAQIENFKTRLYESKSLT